MRTLAIGLLMLVSSACTLTNLTPQARFSESAYTLNDAARWGQLDLALRMVSPRYMSLFTERHREWGQGLSIADADLVRMQIADDRKTATSEVSLNWYAADGVHLRNSVITQTWEADHGHFRLVSETIRRGDPAIFAEPEAEDG